tara:strand:+ start:631 stop:1650 length:1020 start_codon:yes stop_codon:yes gene_type:complete
MKINIKNLSSTIFFLILFVSIQGCFSKPKEGAPPGRLLTIGQVDLDSERYENAKKAFELLLKKYPNSKHRRKALFNLAEVYYRDKEYLEAQVQFTEFVQLYPISKLTDRAYYLLAMSYYNVTNYHDQDQENTHNALKNFKQLLARFPKSEYRQKALQKIKEINEFLSEHDYAIAFFYFKKEHNVSCIPRFRKIILKYPESLKVKEKSLFYLGNAYFKEQSYEKAWRAFMQLLKEFPRTELRNDTIRFLNSIKMASIEFKNKQIHKEEKGFGLFNFFKDTAQIKKKVKKPKKIKIDNPILKKESKNSFNFFDFFKKEPTKEKETKNDKNKKGFNFLKIFK